MERKNDSLFEHLDFILLDILCFQVSFLLGYLIYNQFRGLPYTKPDYVKLNLLMTFVLLIVTVVLNTYRGVLTRGYYIELIATFKHVLINVLVTAFLLFAIKSSSTYSRVTLILIYFSYFIISYFARVLYKRIGLAKAKRNTLFVITTESQLDTVIATLSNDGKFGVEYKIIGAAIADSADEISRQGNITIITDFNKVNDFICREWVDAVYIDFSASKIITDEFIHSLYEMGITIFQNIDSKTDDFYKANTLFETSEHLVLASEINYVPPIQMILKRALDIIGGFIGLIITGVLLLFVIPLQQIESRGPVFFNQERIGKNGRHFKMYKIRSMYPDAEERKKEYLAQNTMSDNMMFKLDWDPRIIGNKTLPDGTKKAGIGEFIRKSSIDEFPQFLNVLKGEMSLVGTRPPTVDEWEKYQNHHRARLAMKPGITGMWQVSGRSKITDFEEVVRLDTEYIRDWTPGLDIRILIKTLSQVIKGEGAK